MRRIYVCVWVMGGGVVQSGTRGCVYLYTPTHALDVNGCSHLKSGQRQKQGSQSETSPPSSNFLSPPSLPPPSLSLNHAGLTQPIDHTGVANQSARVNSY